MDPICTRILMLYRYGNCKVNIYIGTLIYTYIYYYVPCRHVPKTQYGPSVV
jgi:hypothetical protein